jgi:hypothetical protein
LDGNLAAVGAIAAGDVSRGKVFVFRCVDGVWMEDAILLPPTQSTSSFGFSIALRENRSLLVVGAPVISNLQGAIRTVRLYRDGGDGWSLTETLTASDGAGLRTGFGSSVSLSGNRLVIGAFTAGDPCPQDPCESGAAFFFEADASCEEGSVGAGSAAPENVLLVNGSPGDEERTVRAALDTPLEFSLLSSSHGPVDTSYVLYAWRGYPSRCTAPGEDGLSVGCFANPTPFDRFLSPQPHRCFRSPGIPDLACRGVREKPGPPTVPWTLTLQRGLPAPAVFTLQGIIRDDGSGNASGYSATNMVVLEVD